MSKRKLDKKLVLNKVTVANLGNPTMANVFGGGLTTEPSCTQQVGVCPTYPPGACPEETEKLCTYVNPECQTQP